MEKEFDRSQCWRRVNRESRQVILATWLDVLLAFEPDISTEQLIQRVIDTFGCEHREVIDALALMANE